MTDDLTLTDFLLARIAEDEEVILNGWDSDGKARVASVWTGAEPGYSTVASDQCDGVWIADGREVEDARHVQILFDPARMLAECEAKRRIVDYREASARESMQTGLPIFEARLSAYDAALRALALPYADHPDYREEWKP